MWFPVIPYASIKLLKKKACKGNSEDQRICTISSRKGTRISFLGGIVPTASYFLFPATTYSPHIPNCPSKVKAATDTDTAFHPWLVLCYFHTQVPDAMTASWQTLSILAGGADSCPASADDATSLEGNKTLLSTQKKIICRCSNSQSHQHQKVQTCAQRKEHPISKGHLASRRRKAAA